MKLPIINTILLVPLFSLAVNETPTNFQVPSDWRVDPPYSFTSNGEVSSDDPAFVKGTDLILKTHLDALNGAKLNRQNSSSWHLHSILFDLGVSGEGRLGSLLLRGTPSVNIYWSKRQKQTQGQIGESEQNKNFDSEMAITNERALDTQVSEIITGIYASGRVRYSSMMESEIKTTAKNFFAMMDATQVYAQKRWKLSKVRLDLNVGASGAVTFIQTVGGSIRIRLDWVPLEKAKNKILSSTQSTVVAGMNHVLEGLINELDLWSATNANVPTGFQLSMLRVGLGMGARFEVGVAKSNASAIVHAFFVPNPVSTFVSTQEAEPMDEGIPFTFSDNQASWAHAFGMAEPSESNFMNVDFSPIVVKRERIQNGLNRAMKIGKFFVNRSTSVLLGSEWYVSRIKTGLDLNLAGTFELATLAGMVSMEATFNSK